MTSRPDATTVTGYTRDGSKIGPFELTGRDARMLAQLAQIMVMLPDAIEREKREQSTRRSAEQPEPIRLEIVDYRQNLLHRNGELAGELREGRKLLRLSNRVQKLTGYRCPECESLALILDQDEWEVWCSACDLRWPVDGSQIAAIIEQQQQETA
jgi:DNA-directed RNA polymerase subunit RPC12/RpoP